MCLGSGGMHVELDEEVVAGPPAPQALAVKVDGDAEHAHGQGGPAEGEHDLFGSLGSDPVVGKVGETVKHEVLENKKMLECERRRLIFLDL